MTNEDDLDLIVAYAAHKLVQDLQAVAAAVCGEFCGGGGPGWARWLSPDRREAADLG